MISYMGKKMEDKKVIAKFEEQLISDLLQSPELRRYDQEKIVSQIFLDQDFGDLLTRANMRHPNPVITITELKDRVEVFRYNLNYNPIRLSLDFLSIVFGLGPEKVLPRITYFGIMPKKVYNNLFEFLERKNVWEIKSRENEFDSSPHSLLISKNQRKHAFTMDPIYNLIYLGHVWSPHAKSGIKEIECNLTSEERGYALRFLDISRAIYSKSKRYAETKI